MLVVACVKHVPDTTHVKVDPVTNTLVREGIPLIRNSLRMPHITAEEARILA